MKQLWLVKLHTWLNMEIKQTKIQSLMTSNAHILYCCYIMIPQTVMWYTSKKPDPLSICTWFVKFLSLKFQVLWTGFFQVWTGFLQATQAGKNSLSKWKFQTKECQKSSADK